MLNTLHGRHSHVYCSLQQWQADIQYFTLYHPPALLKPLIATPLPNTVSLTANPLSYHFITTSLPL